MIERFYRALNNNINFYDIDVTPKTNIYGTREYLIHYQSSSEKNVGVNYSVDKTMCSMVSEHYIFGCPGATFESMSHNKYYCSKCGTIVGNFQKL